MAQRLYPVCPFPYFSFIGKFLSVLKHYVVTNDDVIPIVLAFTLKQCNAKRALGPKNQILQPPGGTWFGFLIRNYVCIAQLTSRKE